MKRLSRSMKRKIKDSSGGGNKREKEMSKMDSDLLPTSRDKPVRSQLPSPPSRVVTPQQSNVEESPPLLIGGDGAGNPASFGGSTQTAQMTGNSRDSTGGSSFSSLTSGGMRHHFDINLMASAINLDSSSSETVETNQMHITAIPLGEPTPLHKDIQKKEWDILRLRLSLDDAPMLSTGGIVGKKMSLRRSRGKKALDHSSSERLPKSASKPIKVAHCLAGDTTGRTPLHLLLARHTSGSIQRRNLGLRRAPDDVVLGLIDMEPRAAIVKDLEGQLPIHVAAREGHSAGVVGRLLEEYAAATLERDKYGRRPLDYAVEYVCTTVKTKREEKRERSANQEAKEEEVPLDPEGGSVTFEDESSVNTQDEELWDVVKLLLLTDKTKQDSPSAPPDSDATGQTPVLIQCLANSAPDPVVKLMIPMAAPLFSSRLGLTVACTALYMAIAHRYPLSTMQSLTEICPDRVRVVRDETGMGLVSASYIVWSYSQRQDDGAWVRIQEHHEILQRVIEEKSTDFLEHDGQFMEWWASVMFWVKFCRREVSNPDGGDYKRDNFLQRVSQCGIRDLGSVESIPKKNLSPCTQSNPSLLHAALSNPDTPLQVIQMIASLHPEQFQQCLLNSGNLLLPLHIACITQECTPRHYEDCCSQSNIDITLNAYPRAAKVTTANKTLPLHLALWDGRKSWMTGIAGLVREEPRALRVRDRQNGLYPWQMAACARKWSNDHKIRFGYLARNKFSHSEWRSMSLQRRSKEAKIAEKEQELDALNTVFELLRKSVPLMGEDMVAGVRGEWPRPVAKFAKEEKTTLDLFSNFDETKLVDEVGGLHQEEVIFKSPFDEHTDPDGRKDAGSANHNSEGVGVGGSEKESLTGAATSLLVPAQNSACRSSSKKKKKKKKEAALGDQPGEKKKKQKKKKKDSNQKPASEESGKQTPAGDGNNKGDDQQSQEKKKETKRKGPTNPVEMDVSGSHSVDSPPAVSMQCLNPPEAVGKTSADDDVARDSCPKTSKEMESLNRLKSPLQDAVNDEASGGRDEPDMDKSSLVEEIVENSDRKTREHAEALNLLNGPLKVVTSDVATTDVSEHDISRSSMDSEAVGKSRWETPEDVERLVCFNVPLKAVVNDQADDGREPDAHILVTPELRSIKKDVSQRKQSPCTAFPFPKLRPLPIRQVSEESLEDEAVVDETVFTAVDKSGDGKEDPYDSILQRRLGGGRLHDLPGNKTTAEADVDMSWLTSSGSKQQNEISAENSLLKTGAMADTGSEFQATMCSVLGKEQICSNKEAKCSSREDDSNSWLKELELFEAKKGPFRELQMGIHYEWVNLYNIDRPHNGQEQPFWETFSSIQASRSAQD